MPDSGQEHTTDGNDTKDAEARANAPKVKNPYLEMANYILNQRKKEA